MTEKLTLSLATATFIAVLAGLFLLRGVDQRVAKLEAQGKQTAAKAETMRGTGKDAEGKGPTKSTDPLYKLNWLIDKTDTIESDNYEYYKDLTAEIYNMKRAITQVKIGVKRIRSAMASGGAKGLESSLPPLGKPLGAEDIKRYAKEAAEHGVKVEQGKVTVRGFLNMAPNKTMPIEYFMTRFPEAGHETLVHLLGNKTIDELQANPYDAARGLPSAVYKGMIAAGFKQGNPFRPDEDSDRENPKWLLPDGDTVYIYVRYELDGKTRLMSATEWVLDPKTGEALPQDAFKFTGSMRREDMDTGDEVLAAELVGLLVSVWPNASAIIEVGLESALANRFTYNPKSMPDLSGRPKLDLDVIFSKTPLESTGTESTGPEPTTADPTGPEPTGPASTGPDTADK